MSFFQYNRGERNGLAGLLLLLLLVVGLRVFWPSPKPASGDNTDLGAIAAKWKDQLAPSDPGVSEVDYFPFDPNTITETALKQLGLPDNAIRAWINYRAKIGPFKTVEEVSKLYVLKEEDYQRLLPYMELAALPENKTKAGKTEPARPPAAFFFDPNTANEDTLSQLGLPRRTVKSIINYRNKGGRFYKPADFGKIYTLDASDLARLQPFIRIAEKKKTTAYTARDTSTRKEPSTVPQARARKVDVLIDINQAGNDEWELLPGIGAKLAARITNFRTKLGGFHTIDQVGETYYLPDSTFQAIRPFLRQSPILSPLPINTADAATLAKHPYLTSRQARALVNYREQHGAFSSEADLRQVRALPTEVVDKLLPYLSWD